MTQTVTSAPEGVLHNEPLYLPGTVDHAVLLLHGFGAGPYEMQWLAEYLNHPANGGLTVQTINCYSEALTRDPMPDSSWEDWTPQILEAFRHLQARHRRVSIIGLSTGATLALWLAAQEPVENLVLLSPFLALKRCWYHLLPLEALAPLVARVQKVIVRTGLDIQDPVMAARAWPLAPMKTFNVTTLRSVLALIRQVKTLVSAIATPALIIQCRNDAVVDPSGADFLMKHLASPQRELYWLTRSNHVITLDYDRAFVYEKTAVFLSRSFNAQSQY